MEQVCSRFHLAARELRTRPRSRTPLLIEDEYDAQYLMKALLRLYFDDVRTEEWTPSYAGGHSKMDFLLKEEKIALELKKTREGLTDKKLGEELIIDIAYYQKHHDVKTLICFIYDPEELIKNPVGLKNDLEELGREFNLVVIIEPFGRTY